MIVDKPFAVQFKQCSRTQQHAQEEERSSTDPRIGDSISDPCSQRVKVSFGKIRNPKLLWAYVWIVTPPHEQMAP